MPDPIYGENKVRVNVSLTPSTVQQLDQLSRAMNISRSEVIERWVRQNDVKLDQEVLGESLTS